MQLTIEHQGTRYRCNTSEAKSLAIKLDFEGPQPNHFGTEKASSSVLKLGGFTGDTLGASQQLAELAILLACLHVVHPVGG